MTLILTDRPADGVLRLAMNRPDKRNALSMDMREALREAFESAADDESVRAIVLTGSPGVFCAGGDIAAMGGHTVRSGRDRMLANHRVVRAIHRIEKPVVAAVEGYAYGAGAGLALLCDTIVAGSGAEFGFPFFKLGLVPDYGILWTLPRRIGDGRARRLIYLAQPVKAAEGARIGLVDVEVPDAEVQAAAVREAAALAAQPAMAFRIAKRFLNDPPASLEAALDAELQAQTQCFLSAEHQEGVAAFREKRKPVFASGGV